MKNFFPILALLLLPSFSYAAQCGVPFQKKIGGHAGKWVCQKPNLPNTFVNKKQCANRGGLLWKNYCIKDRGQFWYVAAKVKPSFQIKKPSVGAVAQKGMKVTEKKALVYEKAVNKGIKVNLKRATLFREWGKVKGKIRWKTFLTILNEPKPADVKNVVFISAGQQAPDPRNLKNTINGYPNVVTGQYRHYKASCNPQCTKYIKPNSLAGRVYQSSAFPKENTLMILVFDSQFNHYKGDRDKRAIHDAFWSLLTKRFYSGNIKKIVLAGQSKGGCIAFGLAKRFRNTSGYENIPLIVQGYDPVCKNNQLLTQGNKRYFSNPLKNSPEYKSMFVDMGKLFPAKERKQLALLDIHGGAPVVRVGPLAIVHSFTYKPNNIDLGWWKQVWVPYEHTDMGGNMAYANNTIIPGFQHIMKYTNLFSSYQPPGGRTVLTGGCPLVYKTKIGDLSGKAVCLGPAALKISLSKCSNKKGMKWQSKYCLWGKKNYWYARPLKGNNPSKCPSAFPKKQGVYGGKFVCAASLPLKIRKKRCSNKKGMNWNNTHCLWGKGSYWHARPLR